MEISIKEKSMNIWDFWAKRYNKLWVQKYSLRPTREYLLNNIEVNKSSKILDLGCGPGELIQELLTKEPSLDITGLDSSQGMIHISKDRNPKAQHIGMDVVDLGKLDKEFDIIISTHSFPYYNNPDKVIEDISKLLLDNGKVYIGFASGNSFYDKLCLFFVKFTTGQANYPSDKQFRDLIFPYFEVEKLKVIRERRFMPRIAIYTLKKVQR